MNEEIRAITVKRKWAERISDGKKWYEVRRFTTDYRGFVVVTISGEKIAWCIVDLMDIQPVDHIEPGILSDEELSYGHWAWGIYNAVRCQPVACIGKLGLWRWNAPLPALLEVVK